METLLYTKCDGFTIRTVYIAEDQLFATVFVEPDGTQLIVDTYKSVRNILENHDFWCRFTGIIGEAQVASKPGRLTLLTANSS